MAKEKEQGRCERDNPDAKAVRGHAYRYVETGNRCIWCNRLSEFQDKIVQAAAAGKRAFGAFVALLLALMSPLTGLFMGYRDREINFLSITGTSRADGGNQEDSVDLSNFGVSVGNMMGMRIWKAELGFQAGDDLQGANPASDTGELTLRTITSGGTSPSFTADGVISQLSQFVQPYTTSGPPMKPVLRQFGEVFPRGLLVVSDRLYLMHQNESGATRVPLARVWYTLEKMTESDWREAFEVWRRA